MNTMKKIFLSFLLLIPMAGLFAVAAGAGDLKAGKAKARACVTCHELGGSSQSPDAHHIGGQVEPLSGRTASPLQERQTRTPGHEHRRAGAF